MQSENLAHSRIGMLWQLGHSGVHTFLCAKSRENRTFLAVDIFVVLLQSSTVLALGCVCYGSVVFIILDFILIHQLDLLDYSPLHPSASRCVLFSLSSLIFVSLYHQCMNKFFSISNMKDGGVKNSNKH